MVSIIIVSCLSHHLCWQIHFSLTLFTWQIYLKEDFFQLFPREVRPWNAMLLWGTAHSRSSLHIGENLSSHTHTSSDELQVIANEM